MKHFVVILFFLSQVALAQRAVPPLWGHRVHDEAKVMKHETVDELELMLKNHQDSTGNQIAILIIQSLEGDDLEEYSLRVAHNEWKLGQSQNDNGVLLLVAIDERKMRIEVGQGLEGVIPDAIANRIIRNEMAPHFREHDYDAGVRAAVISIIKAIGNEYQSESGAEFNADLSWKERILIGAFVFFILGLFSFFGLLAPGCAGWGLYAFLIPFYAVFPMIVLGSDAALGLLGAYLIGFPILKIWISRTGWGKRMIESMGNKGTGGGWSSGSGWSGGGSSGGGGWSSGGGGGFSGGGGSFGGGGSSGSW